MSSFLKWAKVVGVTICVLLFAALTVGATHVFLHELMYGEGWIPKVLTLSMMALSLIATHGCAGELVRALKGTDHARGHNE